MTVAYCFLNEEPVRLQCEQHRHTTVSDHWRHTQQRHWHPFIDSIHEMVANHALALDLVCQQLFACVWIQQAQEIVSNCQPRKESTRVSTIVDGWAVGAFGFAWSLA